MGEHDGAKLLTSMWIGKRERDRDRGRGRGQGQDIAPKEPLTPFN
jgi:hypothetical protein